MPDGSPPWPAARELPRSDGPRPLEDAEYALAPRGRRFLAAMIDGSLNIVPAAFLLMALVPVEDWTHVDTALQQTTLGSVMQYGAFVPVYVAQWTLITITGQSIGKRLFGLRIVRVDGRLPGFLHGVVLRDWVVIASTQVVSFLAFVDVAFVLFPPRRAIHDYIAGTAVVPADFAYIPRRPSRPAGPVVESGPWTAPTQE